MIREVLKTLLRDTLVAWVALPLVVLLSAIVFAVLRTANFPEVIQYSVSIALLTISTFLVVYIRFYNEINLENRASARIKLMPSLKVQTQHKNSIQKSVKRPSKKGRDDTTTSLGFSFNSNPQGVDFHIHFNFKAIKVILLLITSGLGFYLLYPLLSRLLP